MTSLKAGVICTTIQNTGQKWTCQCLFLWGQDLQRMLQSFISLRKESLKRFFTVYRGTPQETFFFPKHVWRWPQASAQKQSIFRILTIFVRFSIWRSRTSFWFLLYTSFLHKLQDLVFQAEFFHQDIYRFNFKDNSKSFLVGAALLAF